ncbi:LPXTG cell wall anchor domain-containing protein [Nonomuraea indica]|uniref:LPXTG cell wall anchor domain-containing protein n=1 Tax=Nonomuraea indica TaxID=1581193 RepID=UPI000C7BD76C|nr:LPXTG cell wall anchor domain-containing protein [Nonomuraea indica]
MAASAAFVATPAPGQAQASLIAKYLCTGGVAGGAGVEVEAVVTPRLEAGGMLDVNWALRYATDTQFGSPGFFAKGSTLNLEGMVEITGAWNGQLRPKGFKDQPELVPGDFLDLPEGLSDAGSVRRPGTIRVRPGDLFVRFKPAKGEVMVNDNNPAVEYSGTWTSGGTAEEFGDHLYDLHETSQKDAVARLSFTGTQVAYISRRERGLGPVRVLLDGKGITDPLVEPGKDRNGVPMTGTRAKEVLWKSPVLKYGPHTIEIVNAEAEKAYVDAFQVTTGEIGEPPTHNQATCKLKGDPGAIELTVPGNSPSPTPTTPTPDPSKTPTTTPTLPTPTGGTTPPVVPSNPYNPGPGDNVAVVSTSPRPTRTTTVTATPKPTTTRFVKAQVLKTPKGGVDTGEAPETGGAGSYGLIAGGSVLLMGSATGGLLLRRRRATHAGGAQR